MIHLKAKLLFFKYSFITNDNYHSCCASSSMFCYIKLLISLIMLCFTNYWALSLLILSLEGQISGECYRRKKFKAIFGVFVFFWVPNATLLLIFYPLVNHNTVKEWAIIYVWLRRMKKFINSDPLPLPFWLELIWSL